MDPHHANIFYNGEEIIKMDGATPICWVFDDGFGTGLSKKEAFEILEDIASEKENVSYFDDKSFSEMVEERKSDGEDTEFGYDWFEGNGYYDVENKKPFYLIGDESLRDDVCFYSIEEF